MIPLWIATFFAALTVLACGFAIGVIVYSVRAGPAIAARDEAITLAIGLIAEAPDPIFGVVRADVARFYVLVREIPGRWVPPSTIIVQR